MNVPQEPGKKPDDWVDGTDFGAPRRQARQPPGTPAWAKILIAFGIGLLAVGGFALFAILSLFSRCTLR